MHVTFAIFSYVMTVFVLICDIYKDLEVKYLRREFNKLFNDSNEHVQTNLALFLFHATERRTRYVESLNDNSRH